MKEGWVDDAMQEWKETVERVGGGTEGGWELETAAEAVALVRD